jgi:hypothetical protein
MAAREILERGLGLSPSPPPRSHDSAADVLVRRCADRDALFGELLSELENPYGPLVGSVRDLLDAGLEPVQSPALEELLDDVPDPGERRRAQAIVKVASKAIEESRRLGVGLGRDPLVRARELLENHPAHELFPCSALAVYGFFDATAVATDLIRAMARSVGSTIYVDHPPEPGTWKEPDASRAFTRRLSERLLDISYVEEPEEAGGTRPHGLSLLSAPGAEAEVRYVASTIRRLLSSGPGVGETSPESIGIVARDLAPYMFAIRAQLGRLAVPFSCPDGQGPKTPLGRRMEAVAKLLGELEDASPETWLDGFAPALLADPERQGERHAPWLSSDLLIALRAQGATRLSVVGDLSIEDFPLDEKGESVTLPTRAGLSAYQTQARPDQPVATRRRVSAGSIEWILQKSRALLELFETHPRSAFFAAHLDRVESLLTSHLGWSSDEARQVKAELSSHLPLDMDITFSELRSLLGRWAVGGAGRADLGGRGGGVQVLSVTQARGRTFDHLFVLGVNRGLFPRSVQQDPLLPDSLRGRMQVLLPDIPIKSRGHDEERYYFAQLLSSSPSVTLSFRTIDEDGSPLSPSPLIEKLRGVMGAEIESLPPLYHSSSLGGGGSSGAKTSTTIRPAYERAVLAGLSGDRTSLVGLLERAVTEARATLPGLSEEGLAGPEVDPRLLAKARFEVLSEHDPDLSTSAGRRRLEDIGPYLGFIGPPTLAQDPRNGQLYITTIESFAKCPWRVFVTRLLRIERLVDPLEKVADTDGMVMGSAVHEALSRVVQSQLSPPRDKPHTLDTVLARQPVLAEWPGAKTLEPLLAEVSQKSLTDAGLGLAGLDSLVQTKMRPYLEAARDREWRPPHGPPAVIGAEVEGELEAKDARGRLRVIRFRADRVDRHDEVVRLTDYKTSKPISTGKRPSTRRSHYLRKVREGANLQATAYELAVKDHPARGRYVFLKPGIPDHAHAFDAGESPEEFVRAFEQAVTALLEAWDQGAFFPMLKEETGKDGSLCKYCPVAEACLRRDSGAKRRLQQWLERHKEADSDQTNLDRAEAALLRAWFLGEGDGK